MGDVGELLKLSSCHQGSQLWWNDILFMPSQCIFILIAIAYLYQLCNSTDWFSFIEFDGIRGFDKYLHVYSIADIDMPIDMLVRTATPTCRDIHHHTTDVWLLSGHPRVATGHAVSGQTRLCRRPWVLPQIQGQQQRWPGISCRTFHGRTQNSWCDFFCHRAVGVATPQGPRGQEGAGTLWFCPQRVAVATEVPCRVSWSPSWHIGFLVVLLR